MSEPADIAAGLFQAVPLDVLSDITKFSYVLDRLVEHESEWSDFQADANTRRVIASNVIAEALAPNSTHAILEVWRLDASGGERLQLVGLLGFSHIVPRVSAQLHPVFFDGKLRNASGKRELLLRAMDWAFQQYDLHRIGVEIPETSFALVDFVRRKLGFRFEGEGRILQQRRAVPYGHRFRNEWVAHTPSAREAEWGSRHYQAVFKDGRWRDMLLLSVTRDEFATFVREALCPVSSISPLPSKPSPATSPADATTSSNSSSGEVAVAPPAPEAEAPFNT